MAFRKEKFPTVRLSDIDDLMRENALDSSDGQKLIDYIRRKQGAARPRPNLLLDGADNRINFRFENLQPAPPPPQSSKESTQTITVAAETACGPSATSPGVALLQPSSINNRIASFVTPMKGTPSSPLRSPLCMENSAVNRIPRSPSRIPVQKSGSSGNLNRQTLIKECQRANQLKCEILRKITSSTPNAGERTQRSDDNFLSFKETISPIFEDRSTDRRPASQANSGDAVQPRLDGTVPATQDQPGAVDRNARESTPPPVDEPLLVIPETPSPVRRTPTLPATPFSALRSPSIRKLFEQRRMSSQPRSQQRNDAESLRRDSVDSTPQKSILKRRCTNLAPEQMVLSTSPQNRVSFCEHLNQVLVVSPAYARSPQSSDMTTDESSEEEEEVNEAQQKRQVEKQKEASRRSTKPDGVGHRKSNGSVARPSVPLRSSQLTRTDAIDLPVASSRPARTDGVTTAQWDTMQRQMEDIHGPESPDSPSRKLRRRTLSFSDIIRNGVTAPDVPQHPAALERSEDDDSERENAGAQVQPNGGQSSAGVSPQTSSSRKSAKGGTHRAKNRTNGIAVDMLMENWGGSDSSDDSRSDERPSAVPPAAKTPQTQSSTITTPMAITTIDTPHTVLMEIFEPPSGFCDDTTTGADSLPMEVEQPRGEEGDPQGHDRSDTLNKRKQSMPRKKYSASPRPTVTKEVDEQPNLPMKADSLKHRMKSLSSPMDHVSSRMIDVVDMIHSQAASVFDDPTNNAEDSRRTTIVLPTKRRRAKSTIDGDTQVYFKTVEQAGVLQKRLAKHKGGSGRERRKLFAPKSSEVALISEENIPSPEPLPMTQDDEQSSEPPTANEEDCGRVVQSETRGKNQAATAIKQPAIKTRALAVVLQRLSLSSNKQLDIRNGQQKDDGRLQSDNAASGSAPNSPIAEKQNSEATEKAATAAPTKQAAEDRANEKQRKKKLKKNNPTTKPGYNQKYWKDVSNELRQHVEGEGLRRSNRSRAISAQALWCNPGTDRYDAPRYKMPTAQDILRLYLESEEAKRKLGKEKATRKAKANQGNAKGRSRKRPEEVNIDADGFRVPAVPAPAPASTKPAAIRRDAAWSTSQEDEHGHQSSTNNAVSLDSGISSAVMTNDDVTETLPAPRMQQQKQQQQEKQQQEKQQEEKQQQQQPSSSGTAALDPQAGGQAGGSNGSGEDVASAKRQAMDWMMMLMENQQERQEGATLMAVDIHGFTHCSIDHLTFQRRGNIEYSFYVYSTTDNFGFVRFLPNAVKKMARVTKCSLKFLIMRGSLTFAINGHEVQAVGGDFLMLSNGSSYKISNSSEVSLLFMIKTIIEPTD